MSVRRVGCALSLLSALIAGLLQAAGAGAASDPPEILAIRQLYAQAQHRLKAGSTAKAQYYQADRTAEGRTGDEWYTGEPGGSDQVWGTATIHRIGDKVSFVIVDQSDGGAGDWSQHIEYYFRPDGSLAFVFSALTTFESTAGALLVEKRFYFNAAGKRIGATTSFTDLARGKPMRSADYQDVSVPIYLSVRDLAAVFPR